MFKMVGVLLEYLFACGQRSGPGIIYGVMVELFICYMDSEENKKSKLS